MKCFSMLGILIVYLAIIDSDWRMTVHSFQHPMAQPKMMFRLCSFLAFLLLFSACSTQKTPPGASIISGVVVDSNIHASLLKWDEGLQVILVDTQTSHHSHGKGSTSNPIFKQTGGAKSEGTAGYEWEIETTDGKTAKMKIDGQSFELAKGSFFVIEQVGESFEVKQYEFTFPKTINSPKSLIDAINEDSDIKKWIAPLQKKS